MRLAINIEYDGTAYYGWQYQQSLSTVQEQVEMALSRVAAEKISVICAGRTDAGVHAFGQVAHFDTNAQRSLEAWLRGGNANLPKDIRIIQVQEVAPDFHARYSALARHYRYVIYNSDVAPALLRHRTMWCKYPLDELSMQEAAPYLLGEHDFSSFRGAGCQSKSTMRNISSLDIVRQGGIINIDIVANAFLLHMARNIAGVLIKIGGGECNPIWAQEVLLARDRKKAAITAPAQGLYLVKVVY
jgi:tRNA pseudouridine38-40 synthase